jgi:hypothetical protein
VLDTDPILQTFRFESLGNHKDKPAAIAEAQRRAYPESADVFYVSKNGGYWAAKWSEPVPDLHAKAAKKARTTAAGRAFKKAFSRLEAKFMDVAHRLDYQWQQQQLAGGREHAPAMLVPGVGAVRGAGAPAAPTRDGVDAYDDTTRPGRRRGPEVQVQAVESLPEPEPDPAAELTQQQQEERAQHFIPENERRKLYTHLQPRRIDLLGVDSDHEALHAVLRHVRGLAPNAPVSSKEITYSELEAIVAEIERLPFEDAKP